MPISIRLGDEIEQRLSYLAKITGRPKSYYIKQALEEKLEDMEDIYIAEQRIEASSGERWTLEEMEREIDLAN